MDSRPTAMLGFYIVFSLVGETQTQVLMFAQQMLLPTEPFPQPLMVKIS